LASSISELVLGANLSENARVPVRDEYCPVAKAADVIGDRWSVLMIREMLRGVRRFNEFERSLPGISRSVAPSGFGTSSARVWSSGASGRTGGPRTIGSPPRGAS